MKLFLVRHGQSQWNLENRFTGWKDPDLTEKGIQEARKAGALLMAESFDLAFTSALKRAQHTLEIILKEGGRKDVPVIKDQALNERNYGDLAGLNKDETRKKFGEEQVHIWRRSYDVSPPGGESLKDTKQRVLPYFQKHIEPEIKSGKNILIVAHGNSLRALVMVLENLSPEAILKREIATGDPLVYVLDQQMQVDLSKSGRLSDMKA